MVPGRIPTDTRLFRPGGRDAGADEGLRHDASARGALRAITRCWPRCRGGHRRGLSVGKTHDFQSRGRWGSRWRRTPRIPRGLRIWWGWGRALSMRSNFFEAGRRNGPMPGLGSAARAMRARRWLVPCDHQRPQPPARGKSPDRGRGIAAGLPARGAWASTPTTTPRPPWRARWRRGGGGAAVQGRSTGWAALQANANPSLIWTCRLKELGRPLRDRGAPSAGRAQEGEPDP